LTQDGWVVVRQISGDPESGRDPGELEISASSVIKRLMTKDYRILHLAGHGVYDESSAHGTGMVLGGPPSGRPSSERVLLTAAQIAQMRLVPELVFINCCHLGRIEPAAGRAGGLPAFHRLAATIAHELIRSGVRAIIAAGWAVDDGAAQSFATAFYQTMLAGGNFGDAVRDARETTFRNYPDSNTWAAYQCYGHPGFRLRGAKARGAQAPRPELAQDKYVDACEVATDLRNLTSRASAKPTVTTPEELRQELLELERFASGRDWTSDPTVALELAHAHAELGDLGAGIQWYERAMNVEGTPFAVKDLEQMANLRSRLAFSSYERATKDGDAKGAEAARRACQAAIAEHEKVLLFGDSSERRSLLAGAHKRCLRVEPYTDDASKQRARRHLEKMIAEYERAAALAPGARAYPLLNALFGVLLAGGPKVTPTTKTAKSKAKTTNAATGLHVEAGFRAAIDAIRDELDRRPPKNFWEAITPSELQLLESIAHGSLGADLPRIESSYLEASRLHGSPRELASVAAQLEFVREGAARGLSPKVGLPTTKTTGASLAKQIAELQGALRSLGTAK
jgi:tetratricopeptide (TPR) repeat protein